MSNGNKAALINTLLLFIITLLGGGIAGYLVAQNQTPPVVTTAPIQFATPLNDIIDVQNVWIVEGFSCPMPSCTNPLLTCAHPLAQQIRDWVNNQRASGRDGATIRAEIVQTHGANLNKLPADSL